MAHSCMKKQNGQRCIPASTLMAALKFQCPNINCRYCIKNKVAAQVRTQRDQGKNGSSLGGESTSTAGATIVSRIVSDCSVNDAWEEPLYRTPDKKQPRQRDDETSKSGFRFAHRWCNEPVKQVNAKSGSRSPADVVQQKSTVSGEKSVRFGPVSSSSADTLRQMNSVASTLSKCPRGVRMTRAALMRQEMNHKVLNGWGKPKSHMSYSNSTKIKRIP